MHDYRHTATPPQAEGPLWRRLAPGIALGVVLAGASTVSLMHLTARWQEQAPMRAAAHELRLKAEAEQRLREAAERAPPVAVAPAPTDGGTFNPNAYRAVEWLSEPAYTVSRDQLAPAFWGRRLEVEFRCTAGLDGRLHDCAATERPAGSGLGRVLLPQLNQVRLRPMQVGTEIVEVPVGFSLSFDFRPKPGSQTASIPMGAPPVEASSLPSEPLTDPDPIETTPAG